MLVRKLYIDSMVKRKGKYKCKGCSNVWEDLWVRDMPRCSECGQERGITLGFRKCPTPFKVAVDDDGFEYLECSCGSRIFYSEESSLLKV